MDKKVKYDTVTIKKNAYCGDCGWPIIFVCCNGPFQDFKDASEWDWWLYCSNKVCENHDGEGVFQNRPNWVSNDIPSNSI